jgi:hypothetical protein
MGLGRPPLAHGPLLTPVGPQALTLEFTQREQQCNARVREADNKVGTSPVEPSHDYAVGWEPQVPLLG